jgi:hypothetical protein
MIHIFRFPTRTFTVTGAASREEARKAVEELQESRMA